MNRKIWAYTKTRCPRHTDRRPMSRTWPPLRPTSMASPTPRAAVLKLVAWVGGCVLRGARRYFDKHRFGATSLGDLLEALGRPTRSWVRGRAPGWTLRPSTLSASWETDPSA